MALLEYGQETTLPPGKKKKKTLAQANELMWLFSFLDGAITLTKNAGWSIDAISSKSNEDDRGDWDSSCLKNPNMPKKPMSIWHS